MRRLMPHLLLLFLCVLVVTPSQARDFDPRGLPLVFAPNQGQASAGVKYLAHAAGRSVALTSQGAVLRLDSCAGPVSIRWAGASAPRLEGLEPLASTTSYFLGNDARAWRTAVPNYARVRYQQAFPGVDVDFYGQQGRLEFDFIVAPGADPSRIELQVEGTEQVEVEQHGDLVLRCGQASARLLRPRIYQRIGGSQRLIQGGYVRRGPDRIGFQVASFDRRLPLVLDPVLSYSTLFGGSRDESAWSVVPDAAGNLYLAGRTNSSGFPAGGALAGTTAGGVDLFVMKLNPAGTALIYSAFLGGSRDEAISAGSMAVDPAGNLHLAGWTASTNYPVAAGAAQSTFGGGSVDAFVTKINPTGTALVFSTYLGGSRDDEALGLVLDAAGAVYLAGDTNSANFFVSTDAYQKTLGGGSCGAPNSSFTCPDAFVAKLSSSGAIQFSTLLGASGEDKAFGIALDSAGNTVITGSTGASAFPTTSGAAQTVFGGGSCLDVGSGFIFYFRPCTDVFVARFNATGSALLYSSFLGGKNDDVGADLALDSAGNVVITGWSWSDDFPVTAGALQTSYGGSKDVFVATFNPAGARVYSTYLGGSGLEEAHAIAVDAAGNIYLAGRTSSDAYPTVSPLQSAYGGGDNDAFVTVLDASGGSLRFSTLLGGTGDDRAEGLALDSAGNIFLAGISGSTNFPTTTGSLQAASAGGLDAFLVKIAPGTSAPFNPVPAISTLLPATVTPASGTLTLTVIGTGFGPGAIVRWKGADRPTTFFSSTLLQAAVSAADVTAAGSSDVSVFNPAPRGGTSATRAFSVAAATNTGGLVNAAHYRTRMAAGAIVSLFGTNLVATTAAASGLPLPRTLGNTKVTYGTVDMPLFYASPGQINAQIPFEASFSGQFVVTVNGVARPPVSVSLSSTAPGIFTTTQDGKGPGAVLGPNGPVSAAAPVARNDVVSLFVTGLGSVSPAGKTGEGAPSSPLSNVSATMEATIGGVPATVLFAGLAPGFVGLYQVNVRIPAQAPLGDTVPLILVAGGEYSNVATIAIRQ